MKRLLLFIVFQVGLAICYTPLNAQYAPSYKHGLDKKEADDQIFSQIESSSGHSIKATLPSYENLIAIDGKDLLVSQGEHYIIDSLRSDSYYYIDHKYNKVVPVFDTLHINESIKNLLLQKVENQNFNIDLLHRKYGLDLPKTCVKWADLVSVLVGKGTKCFAAAKNSARSNQVTGVLIINHPNQEYIHMLMLTFDINQLFGNIGNAEPISGLLYTNTPFHNVIELFEEKKLNKN